MFVSRYSTRLVRFDGTNDYLVRGAALTGASNSKLLTVSLWLRKQGSDGVSEGILFGIEAGEIITQVNKSNLDRIIIAGVNSSNSVILNLNSGDGSVEVADGLLHILCSVDLSDTNKRHLYINEVNMLNVSTYTNAAMRFDYADWQIGAQEAGGQDKLDGDLADLWFAPGVYIDFSVEANRRKFITDLGEPAYLGSDGSLPTGTAPAIFFSGPASEWNAGTNRGSGGNFTMNGSVADAGIF